MQRLRAELAEGPSPTRSAREDIAGDEVDLYLPEHGVVIEVDSSLHDNPAAEAHDAAKRDRLERRGLTVYRLR